MEKILNKIHQDYQKNEGNIISLLQDIQENFGYIPEEAVFWFSKKLDIPASHFFGIATFYAQFSLKPRGRNVIHVCMGTACYVKRADEILRIINDEFGLQVGDISDDEKFSLEAVRCLGACGLAPIMVVGNDIHGDIKPKSIKEILNKYK